MRIRNNLIIKNYKLREWLLIFSLVILALGILGIEALFNSYRNEDQSILKGICILIYIITCYYILKFIRVMTRDTSIDVKAKENILRERGELNQVVDRLNRINSDLKNENFIMNTNNNVLIESLLKLEKEKLIDHAIFVWCNYGTAINKKFGFNEFYIPAHPLNDMFKSNTKEKIISFTIYINEKIAELNSIQT